jgi:hypothetical protein
LYNVVSIHLFNMPTKAKVDAAPVEAVPASVVTEVKPTVEAPITATSLSSDLPAKAATITQVIAHSAAYVTQVIKYHNKAANK